MGNMKRRKGSRDGLGLRGRVKILVRHGAKLVDIIEGDNIILGQGDAEVIKTLSTISPSTLPRIINRMAIGDQGTIPADPLVPKVPVKSDTGLFKETFRKDIDSRIITATGTTNETEFVANFDSNNVALTAFSNPSQPRVNEVGLVIIDPTAPSGVSRTDVTAPTTPPSDEVVMSLRTFKSVPFEVANDVNITVRYTIFLE